MPGRAQQLRRPPGGGGPDQGGVKRDVVQVRPSIHCDVCRDARTVWSGEYVDRAGHARAGRMIDCPACCGRPPANNGRSAKSSAPKASEQSIQRALVDLLSRTARPGVAWTHMPAGEARHKGVAGKLKGMGTKPGWPDIIIIQAGQMYGLELKTEAGRVSPAQQQAHADLTAAGAIIAVAYGLDQAVQQLKEWGVVR